MKYGESLLINQDFPHGIRIEIEALKLSKWKSQVDQLVGD